MKVQETMNYGLFSKLNGNRDINELHISRLIQSFEDEYLIKPIDINDKYEVIDGQHRLEVCTRLKLPVYYLMHKGWGLKQAHKLNANQKNWSTEEYLKGYCDLNYKEYLVFREYTKMYSDFNFTVLLSSASGKLEKPGGKDISDFKNGNFKFNKKDDGEKKLNQLLMIKPYYDGFNKTVFAWAIFKALSVDGFYFQDFLSKLAYQSTKLVDCTATKQYLISIEEIYNFKRRGENVRLY